MLGAAIVQDLQTTVAALQATPVTTLVVIDEFSAIAADQVVRLFGRARSAGFSLLLGTQELADLRLPGHERLLEQVLGNLSVLIAHRQVVPDSAELIASIAGTRGAWRVSRHSDGPTTRVRTSRAGARAEPGDEPGSRLGGGAGARRRRERTCGADLPADRSLDSRATQFDRTSLCERAPGRAAARGRPNRRQQEQRWIDKHSIRRISSRSLRWTARFGFVDRSGAGTARRLDASLGARTAARGRACRAARAGACSRTHPRCTRSRARGCGRRGARTRAGTRERLGRPARDRVRARGGGARAGLSRSPRDERARAAPRRA